MTDWAELYRANIDAVTSLAEGLSDDQLAVRVPATPEWSVREVLAHLAGSPADALSGRMDGAPGPEWTARHVAERSDADTGELVAEIRGVVDGVVASIEGNDRPALVWNVAVHHADLHEALGLGAPPEHMWQPVAEVMKPSLGANAAGLRRGLRLRALPGVLLAALAVTDRRVGHRCGRRDHRRPRHLRPPRRRPARARTLRPGVAGAEHRSEREASLLASATLQPVLRIPAAIPLMVSSRARSRSGSSSPRR